MQEKAQNSITVFDLDRTLTRHPTWSTFLMFSARRSSPWRLGFIPVVAMFMIAHKTGILTRGRLKELMQFLMLGRRIDGPRLEALVSAFADHQVQTNLRDGCVDMLRADQAAGRRIVIATAAFEFYAKAIASKIGVTEIVATRSLMREGTLRPIIDGENCFGIGKRNMLEAWLSAQGLDRAACHIRFCSDDASDLPSFNWSDEPIAISPSARLRNHAQRNGWSIFDWKQAKTAGQLEPLAASAV